MSSNVTDKIKNNPKFHELVSKRNKFACILSIIMLVIYYAFILIVAFKPEIFGSALSDETIITLGIPVGVGIIISAFILTGIYVHRANKEFDSLIHDIKRDIEGQK